MANNIEILNTLCRFLITDMGISKQSTASDTMLPITLHTFLLLCVICITTGYELGKPELREIYCSNNLECNYFLEGSFCNESVCSCPDNYLVSGDGSRCLPIPSGYDAVCEDDVQCAAALSAGGVCTASLCACAESHHYRRGVCWRSIPLGDSCFTEDQCLASFDFVGVSCKDGKCQCRDEYYEREGACRRKQNDGETCVIDDDCCHSDTPTDIKPICNKLVCQCSGSSRSQIPLKPQTRRIKTETFHTKDGADCEKGFYLKNGVCVPEIGSSCQSATDNCKEGVASTICIDDRECGCSVPTGVRSLNNRQCSKIAIAFNGVCTESGQCAKFGGNSICDIVDSKKVCTCRQGAHFDEDAQICRVSRLNGESCTVVEECLASTLGGNTECSNGICVCVNGYHAAANGQECRLDGLQVNDKCKEDSDCLFDDSICSTEQQCKCQDHYFSQDGLCVIGIGGSCTDDESCADVPLTTCSSDNTCQCPDTHVQSLDFSTCLPVVNALEKCQQTDQCGSEMGDLKECRDGICQCVEDAQYVMERCFAIKELGEKCSARAECIYPGGDAEAYICQNAKCACQYGYTPNQNQCIILN